MSPTIDDEGFTLTEVMVAIAIVMMVGMAVLGGIIQALSAQSSAEATDKAVQVAVDRLEEVSQLEWDSLGFHPSTLSTTGQTGYDYINPCGSATCATEPVVYLQGTPPDRPLHATVTMSGYKVHAYITWVMPTGETVYPVNQEGERYASKRVRVVVQGTHNGEPVTATAATLIAPRVNQTPPPGVPVIAGNPVAEPATTTPDTQPAAANTCPTLVTATGSPAVVGWNAVTETDVPGGYRIFVNGAQRATQAVVAGTARYTWTSPLYAGDTTYEVRGVSPTGIAARCLPVTWDPNNPG